MSNTTRFVLRRMWIDACPPQFGKWQNKRPRLMFRNWFLKMFRPARYAELVRIASGAPRGAQKVGDE